MILERESINDSTHFYITGYTDTVGTYEVNQKLSNERASKAASYLAQSSITDKQINIRGVGNTNTPYYMSAIDDLIVKEGDYMDPNLWISNEAEKSVNHIDYNSSPEGRFYCRTVIIEIENQVLY